MDLRRIEAEKTPHDDEYSPGSPSNASVDDFPIRWKFYYFAFSERWEGTLLEATLSFGDHLEFMNYSVA